MDVRIRKYRPEDSAEVVQIWNQGWHEAHAAITPADLVAQRTPETFKVRLKRHAASTWVAEAEHIIGFFMLEDDELEQFYVAPEGRGAGVAKRLIEAAETELGQRGYDRAWLACAIGNDRAARFYEKMGWTNVGRETVEVETLTGGFELEIIRYEKAICL